MLPATSFLSDRHGNVICSDAYCRGTRSIWEILERFDSLAIAIPCSSHVYLDRFNICFAATHCLNLEFAMSLLQSQSKFSQRLPSVGAHSHLCNSPSPHNKVFRRLKPDSHVSIAGCGIALGDGDKREDVGGFDGDIDEDIDEDIDGDGCDNGENGGDGDGGDGGVRVHDCTNVLLIIVFVETTDGLMT